MADRTVGRLAKWLRLVGYDCRYEPDLEPVSLLEAARKEGRVLLTRNTKLASRYKSNKILFVSHNDSMEQLKYIINKCCLTIDNTRLLMICSVCNSRLEAATLEQVRGIIPPYVYAKRKEFRRCPSCGRIYWAGTHQEKIIARLQEMLDIPDASRCD